MEKFITKGQDETINIAKEFAKSLKMGDVVLLDGDLGAGKTIFVKGIVEYFSKGKINAVSPTFVLVNNYNTKPAINHFDLYRIKSEEELFNIGFEELIYSKSISLIEWPNRAESFIPKNSIKVLIEKISENGREIIIERQK